MNHVLEGMQIPQGEGGFPGHLKALATFAAAIADASLSHSQQQWSFSRQ